MQVKLELCVAGISVIIFPLGIMFQTMLTNAVPLKDIKNVFCCNGTLGYVAAPVMPCASLNCCDRREIVTVLAVNHAFGFVFRCMARNNLDFSKCFENNDNVVTSNETSKEFNVPKFCCPGSFLDISINTEDTGIIIRCKRRRNGANL